jgi:hypothetical protein
VSMESVALRRYGITRQRAFSLRLDEIQHFVLMIYRNKLRMICNSYGIDDIQGFALICLRTCGIIYAKGVTVCRFRY